MSCCLFYSISHAYKGYEPRLKEKSLKTKACKEQQYFSQNQNFITHCSSKSKIKLNIGVGKSNSNYIINFIKGENVFRFSFKKMCTHHQRAQTADFNQDGKLDLMLPIDCGGVGLAGLNGEVLYFLSNAETYDLVSVSSLLVVQHIHAKNNRIQLVHKEIVSAFVKKDKRFRNFWVYHFLNIQGSKITVSSRKSIWIMYTDKRNRKSTKLLTEREKKRAWQVYVKSKDPYRIRTLGSDQAK